ncbi:MAG: thiamine-phosphate kinase [Actinobacteria bacterium]|nr:thiamine-phosphate kinase [Actinomycetota bacterium]
MSAGSPEQTPFSEDRLIAGLRRLLSGDAPGVDIGVGDDAAVVELGRHPAVLTTDLLVEGVHFRRSATSAHDLGYKAIAVNVSDVAAMGGSPRYATVSLGLRSGEETPFVMELYGGMLEAAEEYGLAVVGGDLSRADRVVISVSLVGEVAKGRAVARSGARPGDRIVVTGALGAAAGGLQLSEAAPSKVHDALGAEWARELFAAQARPVARVGEGQTLAQAGATAMMDLSDGLSLDLSRLCAESGVGARVERHLLPVAAGLFDLQKVLGIDPVELALHGGEDYELLATLPAEAVEPTLRKLGERFGTSLAEVGEITDQTGVLTLSGDDGAEAPLEPRGWDHFARG